MVENLLLIALVVGMGLGSPQATTGVISGRVLLPDGQPAIGIRVSAMVIPSSENPTLDPTTLATSIETDGDGRYRLENISSGRYYITAGLINTPIYYPGVRDINSAKAVAVGSAATVTGIDFTVDARASGVRLSGHLSSFPTIPIAEDRRMFLRGQVRTNPGTREAVVNADGFFEFLKVQPGTYTLIASAAGPWAAPSIVVANEDIVLATLIGSITTENAAPQPRLSLIFEPVKRGAQSFNATILPDGSFRAMLPEGDYRLTLTGVPSGYTVKSVTAGPINLLTNSLNVSERASSTPIRVTLDLTTPPQ